MDYESITERWRPVFQASGAFLSLAHRRGLRSELACLFTAVVGKEEPDAFVDRGSEDDRGNGLLTALGAFGPRLIRIDLPYRLAETHEVPANQAHVTEARISALKAVAADVINGQLPEDVMQCFAEEGLVLQLLLGEELLREGEVGWLSFDLSTLSHRERLETLSGWTRALHQ
jgi:hypothetical protein